MLEFHLGTIIFQLVVVIILILLVSRFALRPLLNIMHTREEHIAEQLSAAEKSQKEAEAMMQKQQEELKKARAEAQVIQEEIKKRAEAEAQDILQQAKERADRTIADAKEEIKIEQERAVKNLRDEVAQLSMLLASKVLEREVDQKDHEKEIERFIQQVGERL